MLPPPAAVCVASDAMTASDESAATTFDNPTFIVTLTSGVGPPPRASGYSTASMESRKMKRRIVRVPGASRLEDGHARKVLVPSEGSPPLEIVLVRRGGT